MKKPLPKVIVIVGPTASGKSAYGVMLAKKIGGEIISADSRQVYMGLDIGTGKITKREMKGIPHHMLDVANPKKVYNVEQFVKEAKIAIAKILEKKKIPIIVGGTGFYIDALIDGTVLVTTIATANGEWMTEEFVPFTAEVKLPASAGSRGTLVLHKDNPSGLPEHDAQLRIPVRFE
jgi:tRNA dimethylallyltransferase